MACTVCPACAGTPESAPLKRGKDQFLRCATCKTQWREAGAVFDAYDASYFEERAHDDTESAVAKAKRQTFTHFWRQIPESHRSRPILELGCSGGLALRAALELKLDVHGFDVTEDILKLTDANGIPRERVTAGELRQLPAKTFGVAAFFDSFEHIPDPGAFLKEFMPYLADDALILMVIPAADTLSNQFLGSLWPHYLPDHWIHYTLRGLDALLNPCGFSLQTSFYPKKQVPSDMIRRHINMRWPWLGKFVPGSLELGFNIGERGMIWKRSSATR